MAVAKRMTMLGAGQFPEYVPITNLLDFYKALVEVNKMNHVICADQKSEQDLVLNNVKNDILLIQFKLVAKGNSDTISSMSFLNMPSDSTDVNATTFR